MRMMATPDLPAGVASAKMVELIAPASLCGLEARDPIFGELVLRLEHQALNALALDEVTLQNLFGIFDRMVGVPDALGIDHHRGPELAAVETAGLVDPHVVEAELL